MAANRAAFFFDFDSKKKVKLLRFLGVDYGEARTGVAVSDPSGMIAQPDGFIPVKGPKKLAEELVARAREKGVEKIVIGLPLNMDGSESEMAREARKLGERLGKLTDIAIEFHDERMTSMAAERALLEADMSRGKRKTKIDAVAAAIMLQSYLDKNASGGGLNIPPCPL